MAIYPVLVPPDPRLRKVCTPVKTIDETILKKLDHMVETMQADDAIGLAANQIGFTERIVVIDVPPLDNDRKLLLKKDHLPYHDKIIKIVNPILTPHTQERIEALEPCLSLPGQLIKVPRFKYIHVSFQDETGQTHEFVAQGLLGICLQHEVSHLDGILAIDYLGSKMKQDMAIRKIQRLVRDRKD